MGVPSQLHQPLELLTALNSSKVLYIVNFGFAADLLLLYSSVIYFGLDSMPVMEMKMTRLPEQKDQSDVDQPPALCRTSFLFTFLPTIPNTTAPL